MHYHSADAGGTDSTTISSDGAPAQFVTRRYVRDSTSGTLKSIDLGLNIGHGNFIYDAPGRRVSTAWPTGGSGSGLYLSTGSHVTQSYNPGISGYLSAAYRVDSAGRIRADSRTQTGTDTVVTNRVFAYDALGRYAGATDASGYSWACSQNRDRYDVNYGMVNCPIDSVAAPQLYSYDAAGNRADPGDTLGVGDQMRAVTFSGMHQDYTYDADGNVITRALPVDNATWVYTWSSDNRLLSGSNWIGVENLAYDALGQPVVIRKGSDNHIARVTLYDGGNVLADLDSLGNRQGEYVYDAGTDHPYALLTGATAVTGVQYFVLDDFGNVTGTVYDSTHGAQTISYDDWGDATVTGDQTNRLAWKGLPIDAHLWLSEVRARWYDPVQGRFISEDPLGISAGINPYVFANNDPINGSDPSGMCDYSGSAQELPCVGVTAIQDGGPGAGIDLTSVFETVLQELGNGGSGGGSFGGGGGGNGGPTRSPTPKSKAPTPPCKALQKTAARLATTFENASTATGALAFGSGVVTALSGAGEGVTFGLDTPVTVSFVTLTGFFGTASTVTGQVGAALNSFAAGNLTALRGFGWGRLANLSVMAAASRIPVAARWSDALGDLAEQATELSNNAQEACR